MKPLPGVLLRLARPLGCGNAAETLLMEAKMQKCWAALPSCLWGAGLWDTTDKPLRRGEMKPRVGASAHISLGEKQRGLGQRLRF